MVSLLMGNFFYISFRHKAETKGYKLLPFWATSLDNFMCEVQKSVEAIKQEILLNGSQLRFALKVYRHHEVKFFIWLITMYP